MVNTRNPPPLRDTKVLRGPAVSRLGQEVFPPFFAPIASRLRFSSFPPTLSACIPPRCLTPSRTCRLIPNVYLFKAFFLLPPTRNSGPPPPTRLSLIFPLIIKAPTPLSPSKKPRSPLFLSFGSSGTALLLLAALFPLAPFPRGYFDRRSCQAFLFPDDPSVCRLRNPLLLILSSRPTPCFD